MASTKRAAAWVLHVDLDQFIAAVEILRRPELAGLPVVVGGRGDPTERAVVSTASYEARAFGVHSGMPLKLAFRKIPDAVFLPVDGPAYDAASAVVMETLRAHEGAVVQVLGWDEAFVGISTPGDDVAEAVAHADAIRAEVFEASELHCSVGVGDTTVRAKIATDFGKPQGTFVLTRDNWFEVMGERPTTALWGVGNRIAARLASHGYESVQQLANASDDERLVPTEDLDDRSLVGPQRFHDHRRRRVVGRAVDGQEHGVGELAAGETLRGRELVGEELNGLSWESATLLDCVFEECTFTSCNLSNRVECTGSAEHEPHQLRDQRLDSPGRSVPATQLPARQASSQLPVPSSQSRPAAGAQLDRAKLRAGRACPDGR